MPSRMSWGWARAVSMRMGVKRWAARRARVMANPSAPGSMQSRTMTAIFSGPAVGGGGSGDGEAVGGGEDAVEEDDGDFLGAGGGRGEEIGEGGVAVGFVVGAE